MHPGDATEEHTATTLGTQQGLSPDLGRQATGHLRHRCEQRQGMVGQLNGLVGKTGHLPLQQCLRTVAPGRQVKVGEQHLARPHAVELLLNGLLDLQDQLGTCPHVVRGGQHLGASRQEVLIGDRRAQPRARLDEHLVTVPDQLLHPGWGDGDAVLPVLDLSRDAHLHGLVPSTRGWRLVARLTSTPLAWC